MDWPKRFHTSLWKDCICIQKSSNSFITNFWMSCITPKLVHAVWCCNRLEIFMCRERYLCFHYLGIQASLVCFCFVSRWFNSGSTAAHSLTQTVLIKTEGWKNKKNYTAQKPEYNQSQQIHCILTNTAIGIQNVKFSQSWDFFFLSHRSKYHIQ